ncbi:DUF357 domain-containing protein [Methanosphaerula palustris]|uniref:DUF357 domain-containing protein n=1 Tax=Methanosphaerula palustris (strain ATCC BAA-1556 / DSM 19958 / E1-9c) TaxID=521011 RepID=B8GIF9_METPE|nr:DUF357 domain-containing protein [Methanosphaerula palustris]ACL15510.1 Protein of unknown function DUF357 [Methanosphaerula palustris E1-9c]
MRIADGLAALGVGLEGAVPSAPEKTPLCSLGGEVIEMARSYREDGLSFFILGDQVNALASAAYGAGWLDAGGTLGLVRGGGPVGLLLMEGPVGPDQQERLEEKAGRYIRMLDEALGSVEVAPDPGSSLFPVAHRIEAVATLFFREAMLRQGSFEESLSCSSYGYGWLDCGARGGLFRVVAARHLFTL